MIWEKLLCDNCGSSNLEPFITNVTTWEHEGKFNLVKCKICNLVFLNPRPTIQQISQYYQSHKYWGNRDITQVTNSVNNKKFRNERNWKYGSVYKKILSFYPQPRTILDIGCGISGFLTAFQEHKWKVLGIDFSQDAANFSHKVYNFPTKSGDFQKMKFGRNKFDVINLDNVLEHLYSPRNALLKINKLLKQKGLLVLTVPNVKSIGIAFFGKNWYALQPPRHLYHFSPETIREILEKNGFKIISVDHFNWNHNIYSLFESFRFQNSTKFRKSPQGGLLKIKQNQRSSLFSALKVEIGKFVGIFFSWLFAAIGAGIKCGEVMTIYAQKD